MLKIIFHKIPTTRPLPDSSSLRKSLSRRQRLARDERGITLQTLIVTAVLVTIAFVAAAIIISITTNQESNLEDQNRAETGVSTCEPWEIRDTELQAQGIGGPQGYGGIWSSAVGCLRVCYVQTRWGAATRLDSTYRILHTGEAASGNRELLLGFSLSDARLAPTGGEDSRYATFQAVSSSEVGDIPPQSASAAVRNAVRTENATQRGRITVVDENEEIRVHPSQEFCLVVDTANDDEEVARSDVYSSSIGRAFTYE